MARLNVSAVPRLPSEGHWRGHIEIHRHPGEPGPSTTVAWDCVHRHPTARAARQCAWWEIRRRPALKEI